MEDLAHYETTHRTGRSPDAATLRLLCMNRRTVELMRRRTNLHAPLLGGQIDECQRQMLGTAVFRSVLDRRNFQLRLCTRIDNHIAIHCDRCADCSVDGVANIQFVGVNRRSARTETMVPAGRNLEESCGVSCTRGANWNAHFYVTVENLSPYGTNYGFALDRE
jgi:hypothetical protein